MRHHKSSFAKKMQRIFLIAISAFFTLVSGCANMRLPKPPLYAPFTAQKAGSLFTTELRVVEHRKYEFTLLVSIKKGENTEDSKRLLKLMGRTGKDKDGKMMSPGIAIPLKLTISVIDTSGESIIYDKEVHEEEMQSGGGGTYEKLIDLIELMPGGHYRVTLQSLQDVPEFSGNPISVGIHGHYNTNPID